MSSIFLLDANILIALASSAHTEHQRATRWLMNVTAFATCPITEGAVIRFYLRKLPIKETKQLVARIHADPRHQFWPDSISYTQLPEKGIVGHRQVTDAYLVALAAHHSGTLATMDWGLAQLHGPAVHFLPLPRA
ncbi:MAG: PIN domain-containing protein [Acidobacteria bacterium]|nr:PIN domain-containing protein [Acidobacteriota bacterium]